MIIHQEKFEAWLFSQPDEREFEYIDHRGCVICSFLKETTNAKEPMAGPYLYTDDFGSNNEINKWKKLPDIYYKLLWDARFARDGNHLNAGDMKNVWRKMFPETDPVATFFNAQHNPLTN
jgi:hypothetical protein